MTVPLGSSVSLLYLWHSYKLPERAVLLPASPPQPQTFQIKGLSSVLLLCFLNHTFPWLPNSPWNQLGAISLFLILIFETAREQRRGTERGRQGPKWVPHRERKARSGARTRELPDHDLSRSRMPNRLSPPGAPSLEKFRKHGT